MIGDTTNNGALITTHENLSLDEISCLLVHCLSKVAWRNLTMVALYFFFYYEEVLARGRGTMRIRLSVMRFIAGLAKSRSVQKRLTLTSYDGFRRGYRTTDGHQT